MYKIIYFSGKNDANNIFNLFFNILAHATMKEIVSYFSLQNILTKDLIL